MLRDTGAAVLLISIDKIDDTPLERMGQALEAALGVFAQDIDKHNAVVEAVKRSDSANPQYRLAIPVTDGILPIHHTGYEMQHNLTVTKLKVTDAPVVVEEGKAAQYKVTTEVTPGLNKVTLKFAMKSSLRTPSTFASFLDEQSQSLASRTVYVTYLSGTMFIRDAMLTGVNRASVEGKDQELFTLTLEVQDREGVYKKRDQLQGEISSVKRSSGNTYSLTSLQAQHDFILPGYLYYPVLTQETLEKIPVPDCMSTERVQGQNFRIFRVVSESRTGDVIAARNLVGIEYRGQLLTLPESKTSCYRGDFGLVAYEDTWYLAVKS